MMVDLESTFSDDEDHYLMVLSLSQSNGLVLPNLKCTHTSLGPLEEEGHVSSARETLRLQGRGLEQIRAYLNNLKLSSNSANPGLLTVPGNPTFMVWSITTTS